MRIFELATLGIAAREKLMAHRDSTRTASNVPGRKSGRAYPYRHAEMPPALREEERLTRTQQIEVNSQQEEIQTEGRSGTLVFPNPGGTLVFPNPGGTLVIPNTEKESEASGTLMYAVQRPTNVAAERNQGGPLVGFLKVDRAIELKEFVRNVADKHPAMLENTVSFGACFDTENPVFVLGASQLRLVDQETNSMGRIKVAESRYVLTDTGKVRVNAFRGVEIQNHLVATNNLRNVVPIYLGDFSGDKHPLCKLKFVLEDIYGRPLGETPQASIVSTQLPAIAARGLEVLKELHSVGLMHGNVKEGLVWRLGEPESIRLRHFGGAKLYVDSAGVHVPITNCRGDGVSNCVSTVVDLAQLSNVLAKLSARGPLETLVADFRAAVGKLAYDRKFDYDSWIAAFRSAVGGNPQVEAPQVKKGTGAEVTGKRPAVEPTKKEVKKKTALKRVDKHEHRRERLARIENRKKESKSMNEKHKDSLGN